MTDILWTSTEENVNWGEWKEVDRLPLGHRLTRWWQKRINGYRYVVGVTWPESWQGPAGANMAELPKPMFQGVFGPVAAAQQQVLALLSVAGGIRGGIVMVAVSRTYDLAKYGALLQANRTRPRYEVSSAIPTGDGQFEAIYTPVDE